MNLYMFEWWTADNTLSRGTVTAANTFDAFHLFRTIHPGVTISNMWVERFGGAA